MKTCSMCGRSVPDGDGMELTDGSFYCISGGCQKKFLDRVVAEKVIPDMVSSGGRVVLMADKPKFDLPPLSDHPAEFYKECEVCHKVKVGGSRHWFHYGTGGSRRYFQSAGKESAWICDDCVNRRVLLSLGLLAVLVLASLFALCTYFVKGFPGNPFVLPAVLILFGIYALTIPYRGADETAGRMAISTKKKALKQQGYKAFMTEKEYKKVR
jgi:hypothetical protein